jgi:DNA-binding PadR family transcriptional regulator
MPNCYLSGIYSYTILVTERTRKGAPGLAVKHGILGILAEGPRHGYELKTQFESLTGGLWELNAGQIYSTLERMLKDGLVELDADEGPGEDRKIYRVTPDGLAELDTWLARPPLKARPMRDEIYVRLGLLVEKDVARALDLLESQRRVYHLQLAELTREKIKTAKANGPERMRREMMLDAALLHVDADLKWLENCEARLRAMGGL